MSDVTQVILAVVINEYVRTPNPTTSLRPSKGLLFTMEPGRDVIISVICGVQKKSQLYSI